MTAAAIAEPVSVASRPLAAVWALIAAPLSTAAQTAGAPRRVPARPWRACFTSVTERNARPASLPKRHGNRFLRPIGHRSGAPAEAGPARESPASNAGGISVLGGVLRPVTLAGRIRDGLRRLGSSSPFAVIPPRPFPCVRWLCTPPIH